MSDDTGYEFSNPKHPDYHDNMSGLWDSRDKTTTKPRLICLEHGPDCDGEVEYRIPLSGSGRSFPRCQKHWIARLDVQEEINRKYPTHQPRDFDPADAGERWDED